MTRPRAAHDECALMYVLRIPYDDDECALYVNRETTDTLVRDGELKLVLANDNDPLSHFIYHTK